MRTSFLPLFTLRVSHSFYVGQCLDFRFLLPTDAERTLRNGKLLAKERDGVLHVLYEGDDDDDPLAPTPGAVLRVGLQLLNPHFGNFTETPAGFPTRKLYYRGTGGAETLETEEPIALLGPVFAHELSENTRPVTVTVRDGSGAELATETVPAGDTRSSVSFDLRGRPPGAIEVTESFTGGGSAESEYYLDAELTQVDLAGIVEITIDAGFYGDPPAFEIEFEAKEEPLSYYVVARNYTTSDLSQLSVTDAGFGADGRDEVEFERIPLSSFTQAELNPLLLRAGSERIVLFRSEDPLARREKARRRIQLSKNGDVLIPNLPQPGADRAKAELIIHLSKP